ncbi:hypothetical protein MMC06_006706 [Schaereria dolodes]|nr:hypothetical protein [Schaereria dolodes]
MRSIKTNLECSLWRFVNNEWWFLGDDAELAAGSFQLSAAFRRSYIPKELRDSKILDLDRQLGVWTFFSDGESTDRINNHIDIPLAICDLPVVVLLPRSTTQIDLAWKQESKFKNITPCDGLSEEYSVIILNLFPFAEGFCYWINGHLQLLVPHLSEQEVNELLLPVKLDGLKVSATRARLTPTADSQPKALDGCGLVGLAEQSSTSSAMPNHRLPLSKTNGYKVATQRGTALIQQTQHNSQERPRAFSSSTLEARSSGTTDRAKSDPSVNSSLVPALSTTVTTPARSDTNAPLFETLSGDPGSSITRNFTSDPVTNEVNIPLSGRKIQELAPAVHSLDSTQGQLSEEPPAIKIRPRLRIRQAISTVGLLLKNRENGQLFLTCSTHAVYEGVKGSPPLIQGLSPPRSVRSFFRSKREERLRFEGEMVNDASSGAQIGTVDKSYDLDTIDGSFPASISFPDNFGYDTSLIKPQGPGKIELDRPCPELDWYNNESYGKQPISILGDPQGTVGETFNLRCIGWVQNRPIHIQITRGEKVKLDSTIYVHPKAILFRRFADPLGKDGASALSGAPIITRGSDGKSKVLGFQSFEFSPPKDNRERAIGELALNKRIMTGNCTICGATPVHAKLKEEYTIVNA